MDLTPDYLYLKVTFMVTFKSTKTIKLIDKVLMPPVHPYIKHVFQVEENWVQHE